MDEDFVGELVIPHEDYSAVKAVNWSLLKHLRKSPLHYQHAVVTPGNDTIGRLKGRATHTALFEPELFESTYPVFSGKTRRGAAWDEFEAAHEGQCILKQSERDGILRMRDAVLRHPVAGNYFKVKSERELSLVWRDRVTGLKCKGRIDMRCRELGALVDLKSCVSLEQRKFEMTAADMGYHNQSAWYNWGNSELNGGEVLQPILIGAEIAPPYDVAVFPYDGAALLVGERENAGLLQKLYACRERNEWPGRHSGETMITLPAYMFGDSDVEVAEGDFAVAE